MIALLVLFYAWRLLRAASRERAAMGEHLAAQERIARDLHDSLLQSVQGLLLGVESILYELPDRELVERHLRESVGQARKIIAETRDRVRDFRNDLHFDALAEVLADTANRVLPKSALDVRVTVDGRPRRINAPAFAELKSIVAEALGNIGPHAYAGRVLIAIGFARRALVLDIAHEGKGTEQAPGDHGRDDGYIGQTVMRAHARKIGAHLTVKSRRDAGIGIRIVVPGRRAYARTRQTSS